MNEIVVKSILNKHKKRDSWFLTDYSVNPYQGCAMNCLYCYIRGSKYGVQMNVSVKKNAVEILDRQLSLRAKNKQFGIIALASATDPYMPIEKETTLTRQFLKVILKHRFPVYVMTRSDLVFRDLDILRQIQKSAILPDDLQGKGIQNVIIASSFCTLDNEIAKRFEPNVNPPMERMEMLRKLKQDGFYVGAHFLPLLPKLTDTKESLQTYVGTTKEYGLDYLLVGSVTLFGNKEADSKTLVLKIIERYYPDVYTDYQKQFSRQDYVTQKYQLNLEKIMKELCCKSGLKYGIS
ncbi:MAG: radical SAM protein [Bacteroidota bacterium]